MQWNWGPLECAVDIDDVHTAEVLLQHGATLSRSADVKEEQPSLSPKMKGILSKK